MLKKFATALLCAATCLSSAQAHITLEQKSAVAGSTYKAIFRVSHGCDASPTTAISVFLPEGFVGAKPMPKAGWKLDIKREKLATPYDSHGTPVTERAAQIVWSGGRLQDSEYDEFVVTMPLPATPGKKSIRVLQQCESGQTDWAEIAEDGKAKPRFPAPVLEVLPAASAPVAAAVMAPEPAMPAGHEHHH